MDDKATAWLALDALGAVGPDAGHRNRGATSITEEERASLLFSRKGELAVVKRQGVRLRSESGLEGNVVSVLPLGEPVTLMESTLTTDTINDQRDLWYRVRTIRGIVGWVFGGHLRICGRRIW